MTDQPKGGSKNIGKWIVIIAVLLFVGIFIFEGIKQGWLNQDALKNTGGYLQKSDFWLNFGIITAVLALVAYLTPPFKQTLQKEGGGSSPYILLAVILIISIFAAVQLGDNLVYKHKFVSWLLPLDGNNNFNFKPLANVGIFWIFFCLLLPLLPIPHFQPLLKKFFQQDTENLKAAPYVIMLLLSLMLAFQLGDVGIWEKDTFVSIEKLLVGERTEGLFDAHTGIYANSEGETRYGILKTKVTGPDGNVFPLGVLGVVLAGLYLLSIFKIKEINALGGVWKFVIFFFIAASAANRGVSLQGIITLVYFAAIFFTQVFIGSKINNWKEGILKKYLPWIGGIIVAEYAAEILNPLTSPPYLPGGVIGKTIILSVIIIAFNFVSNTYNSAVKAGLRLGICQNCGKPCKKEGGAYICATPGCPANSCQEISGIDALSASIGIRIGAALHNFIMLIFNRNREEEKDLDAAEAAAGGGAAETPAERRARLEARRIEIERALEDHRTRVNLLTVTQRNELEAELQDIELQLRGTP